jgi:DivIVA domain-containing protein
MDPRLIDDLQTVTFPVALRGYDRAAVEAFLREVAARIARASQSDDVAPVVRRQLDRFGERAGELLAAADEAAAELREQAAEEVEDARVTADEESRRVVLEAGGKAEEILLDADRRAERIIAEGSRRRQVIEAEIEVLAMRRDELAGELRRISEELLVSVAENTRIEPLGEDADPDELDPGAEDPEPVEDKLEEPEAEEESYDEVGEEPRYDVPRLAEPPPVRSRRFLRRDASERAEL